MRFFGRRDHVLGELGANFDLTRQRVQQIEANALRKLRRAMEGR